MKRLGIIAETSLNFNLSKRKAERDLNSLPRDFGCKTFNFYATTWFVMYRFPRRPFDGRAFITRDRGFEVTEVKRDNVTLLGN